MPHYTIWQLSTLLHLKSIQIIPEFNKCFCFTNISHTLLTLNSHLFYVLALIRSENSWEPLHRHSFGKLQITYHDSKEYAAQFLTFNREQPSILINQRKVVFYPMLECFGTNMQTVSDDILLVLPLQSFWQTELKVKWAWRSHRQNSFSWEISRTFFSTALRFHAFHILSYFLHKFEHMYKHLCLRHFSFFCPGTQHLFYQSRKKNSPQGK